MTRCIWSRVVLFAGTYLLLLDGSKIEVFVVPCIQKLSWMAPSRYLQRLHSWFLYLELELLLIPGDAHSFIHSFTHSFIHSVAGSVLWTPLLPRAAVVNALPRCFPSQPVPKLLLEVLWANPRPSQPLLPHHWRLHLLCLPQVGVWSLLLGIMHYKKCSKSCRTQWASFGFFLAFPAVEALLIGTPSWCESLSLQNEHFFHLCSLFLREPYVK